VLGVGMLELRNNVNISLIVLTYVSLELRVCGAAEAIRALL
jgi:hypothetical protein